MDFLQKLNKEIHASKVPMIFMTLVFAIMLVGFVNVKHVTIVDGAATREITTTTSRVDRILKDAGIHLDDKDEFTLSTKGVKDGTVIHINRATLVTIEHGDRARVYRTAKKTVGEVLESVGLSTKEYVALPGFETEVTPHMNIRVLTKAEHEKEMRDARIAEEEVGGIFDGIRYSHVLTMEASAYLPTDGGGDCVTATGMHAGHGIVAVDPDIIPLGTMLYIPGYGHAIAAGTCGMIEGHMIDLCMESYEDAIEFGRRDIEVYVLQ